jgi:hypothetical protein
MIPITGMIITMPKPMMITDMIMVTITSRMNHRV